MLVVTGLLLTTAPSVAAKSLYVIANIDLVDGGTPVQAYDIGPDGKLTFQTQYTAPYFGHGAVGLALDSKSKQLYMTYEASLAIVVLDPTRMNDAYVAAAEGATNLAGIVYDQGKDRLYCMDRNSPTLYAFQWDAQRKYLVPVAGSPFLLAGSQAFGIALDEVKGELYVGGPAPTVRVYRTSDWQLVRTIPVSHVAISVAIDPVRRFLYLGGGYPVTDSYFLTQYDLVTAQQRQITVDPTAGVMGLGVDSETGCIYVSTGRNNEPGGDDLLVFNTDLGLIDRVDDIGNPTGLVVPAGPISYNPLRLTKTVQQPVGYDTATGQDLPQVVLGEEFTYSICFDHNDLPLTNVSVVDTLPAELTFVRAPADGLYGQYDARTHTYTWLNPPKTGGPTTCLELVCRVDPNTPVGRILANAVTLKTQQTPPTTTRMEVVTIAPKVFKPLHVSKTVLAAAGSAGPPASVQAGDEVTYRIAFDNRSNAYPAHNVRLTDTLPPQALFVRATGDGVSGRYEPMTHTYTWFYPSLAPGDSNSVDITVRLVGDLTGETTITNAVALASDDTPSARASVDLPVAAYVPLTLGKTLAGGAVGTPDGQGRPHVEPGSALTYAITFANPAMNGTVTEVSLVDTLPRAVSFLRADGDGDWGFYDPNTRTYTWRYSTVEPGRQQSVNIVVQVQADTPADTVLRNSVTLTSRQTASASAVLDVITTAASGYRPLNVTKTVVAGATQNGPGIPAAAPAGGEVTYRISFDNRGNSVPVTNVWVRDDLPWQASLVRTSDGRLQGHYEPLLHTYTWSCPQLAPQESYTADVVVRVNPDVAVGTLVTNAVTAWSDQTPPARAELKLSVAKPGAKPLSLRKTLASGGAGSADNRGRPYVDPGATLTYTLSVGNPSTNPAVTQVSLLDTLPAQVTFVQAQGGGGQGTYDSVTHTYTWRSASLAPGAEQSLNLVVRVMDKVDPNTIIVNVATVTAAETVATQASAEVVVRSVPIPPVNLQGVMYVKPDHIFRNDSTAKVSLMVVAYTPAGIGMDAIADVPLVLTPGNGRASGQLIFGTSTQGKVLGYFDVAPILAATEGYGQFTLRVAGQLKDGRSFVCEAPFWILKFGGP